MTVKQLSPKRKDWFTEDGTFIGPWWLRWAFLTVGLAVPAIWFAVTGSISFDAVALWIAFLAVLNLLRAGRK